MNRIILELSLKPFRDISDEAIYRVCAEILRQWQPLLHGKERLSFLLWTADGSEILDYRGDLSAEFEWAKWLGIANLPTEEWAQNMVCLHSRRWEYMENPPAMTYERLRFIVRALKETANRYSPGITVTVGATFDPGPEFAESDFKYQRHPELCQGDIMGDKRWVHCAGRLHADTVSYAGFPGGIAEGTTLGTFLGRQSQHFLTDLGFDYIWFSNGFGYSLSSWNVTGEVFDGERFDRSNIVPVRDSILQFWEDFRRECPHFPIETRGSNLSTGMDLSSDASPVRQIYQGNFNLTAPVNSPWAALNGDYGLELVGWLSHIAELPEGSGIPFRYYIHDPWWINSPWLDRYGREPHDIYLPLALGRMNGEGAIDRPSSVALLTIDNSYGEMPEAVAREVTPHIYRALEDFPDAPGLVTWIYPFDEYHDWTFGEANRVDEVFFGDWFMRAALNHGFPLSTVVSSANFLSAFARDGHQFKQTILLSPAPDQGAPLADALLRHLEQGGRVLLYGPLRHADERLLAALELQLAEEISGTVRLVTGLQADGVRESGVPDSFEMRPLLSGGGLEAIAGDSRESVVAEVQNADGQSRVFAAFRSLASGGELGWVRGALGERVSARESLPIPDDPRESFRSERLMRWVLQKFGCTLRFEKPSAATPEPLVIAARSRNGWFFSGFTPSTNTRLQWRFPYGVPIPVGCEVQVENGLGSMSLAKAWHRECRLFVEQVESGEIACVEMLSGEVGVSRRMVVKGLKNARLRVFADTARPGLTRIQKHDAYLGLGTPVPHVEEAPGILLTEPVSGDVVVSWE